MEHVSVDLWAANLQVASPDLASWLAQLEARMADAAARGVHLLVLPEFCCAQWLAFAPIDLDPSLTLKWLADTGLIAMDAMKAMAVQYGVSLIPGTIPFEETGPDGQPGFRNRAWLLTPDGAAHCQDKLSLTPLEANGAGGVTLAGDSIQVIQWNGLRIAIAICLDAEYTALWSRLGELDLDMVIIPAKTDMITGYNRVFGCARARAIELQTVICAVGAVGAPLTHPAEDTGMGGAAVYLPCDVSVSLDGVFAATPAQSGALGDNGVLRAVGIPVGLCRALRNGYAEAELRPALWSADHLAVI